MTATMEEATSNFYGDQLSASQYEELMGTFSRSSSHAVDLSRAIAADLRLGELSEDRQERMQHDDDDTTRIVDLGAGPGVFLGGMLKHVGLIREVFTGASVANTASTIRSQIETEFGNKDGMNRLPITTTRAVDKAAAAAPPAAPSQKAAGAASLSVWCVDPFYYNEPRSESGSESTWMTPLGQMTLPTDVDGCRLEVIGEGRVHFVSADAIEFLQSCRERIGLVDRILMKEVIHHVRDYGALCEGLRRVLRPGTGMVLIAGRTPSGKIPWFPQVTCVSRGAWRGGYCIICCHSPDISVSPSSFTANVSHTITRSTTLPAGARRYCGQTWGWW